MGFTRRTPATLEKFGRLQAGEEIVDGGPARSREADRRNMALLEEALGGTANVRAWAKQQGLTFATVLEADMVVTNPAIYYAAFNPQILSFVEWNDLTDVEMGKVSRFRATTPVTVVYASGRRDEYQVSRGSAGPIVHYAKLCLTA